MARITWNNAGEKFYETGVDRGVLYVDGDEVPGVPWNGLVAIRETPSGVTNTPYYIDGVKYLNTSTHEEFEATIEAYSSPVEFDLCDGTSHILNGLYITQQARKAFGMCYRTKVGNDIDGIDHAYKIHLVYNALASPTEQNNFTLNDSSDPNIFSWSITTIPTPISGYKPSAHFIIDSTKISAHLLYYFENIIYGSPTTAPRLPTIQEIIALFSDWIDLVITDNGDGTWTAVGDDRIFEFPSATEFAITSPSAKMIDDESYIISSF